MIWSDIHFYQVQLLEIFKGGGALGDNNDRRDG